MRTRQIRSRRNWRRMSLSRRYLKIQISLENNSIYMFLHHGSSVLFFHLRLPNKSSNFLLGISISSRVFSGLEIKESTFWKKNIMMTRNILLFNLLLWWSFLGELNQKLALKMEGTHTLIMSTNTIYLLSVPEHVFFHWDVGKFSLKLCPVPAIFLPSLR